jgi:hypothetical protein
MIVKCLVWFRKRLDIPETTVESLSSPGEEDESRDKVEDDFSLRNKCVQFSTFGKFISSKESCPSFQIESWKNKIVSCTLFCNTEFSGH